MKEKQYFNPVQFILIIYLACFSFRMVEYLLIRTDQSFFGEAFIHKLIGIFVLVLAARFFSIRRSEIGFTSKFAMKNSFYGLLLGFVVYIITYGSEFLIQFSRGNIPSLQIYVTSYAISGNQGKQTAFIFFALCVIGNIINVIMEEGIFRGLFIKLGQTRYSFIAATIFSSVLFGLWHVAAPVRSLLDGEMSSGGAAVYALMLILTTGIVGVKFCLLTKITGSLWMSMADHFFNNTIINILHIVSLSGVDELQIIRISIAQAISFLIALFIYWKSRAHSKSTFRG